MQNRMPLVEAMLKYKNEKVYPFHTPGHKGGRGQLYGSDRCFFAVNGTTGAIHAMLMAACKAGDKVLVPRNAHRSVAGALLAPIITDRLRI